MNKSQPFQGFSSLSYKERLQKLLELGFLEPQDLDFLKSSAGALKDHRLADTFIENAIGYFALPLAVAVNFVINKTHCAIPLAVEETSVIAAASKAARMIAKHGSLTARAIGRLSTGQIQIAKVKNYSRLKSAVERRFPDWRRLVNESAIPSMARRGGGLKSFELRKVSSPKGLMAVLHLYIDTCEAMGANTVNRVCEFLKGHVEEASGERVSMSILSNLADQRLFKAEAVLFGLPEELAAGIEEASLFAESDPYRAATHNKGALNSMDALCIATGNDWRALEAGLHSYAARGGSYSSISKWRVRRPAGQGTAGQDLAGRDPAGRDPAPAGPVSPKDPASQAAPPEAPKTSALYGEMETPLMIGTVGGVTDLHPTARLALKILKNPSAERLSEICVALGLTQNFAALHALATEGIMKGHIRLHAKNLALRPKAK